MTIHSIATPASSFALNGLNRATQDITSSSYRLSTGDRFYRAGDDVAGLSIATRMQTNLTSFRQALQNNAQADSLLQVAYGGLSQINSILDDMKGLATQANSGSLTSVERALLDLEFQTLRQEIDRIASQTNFNGINLLDGSISQDNDITTNAGRATQASGSIAFISNPSAGQTINVNGFSAIAGTHFAIGGTTGITAGNFADFLNNSTDLRVSRASYQAMGSVVQITAKSGGSLSNQFLINEAASTAAAAIVVSGRNTAITNVFALSGGLNDGLNTGSTTLSGTVGDSLVTPLNQTAARQTIYVTANGSIANNQTINIDNGSTGTIAFRARTSTLAAATDFLVGATAEQTLQNLVNTIRGYATNSDFVLNQLDFEIRGNDTLIIRGQLAGNVLDQNNANAAITESTSGTIISGTSLNNGTNTGINLSGVSNPDFVGTISGFSAAYQSADNITASLTVGNSSYTARITDTTPAAATFVRFNSSDGGFFDVQIAAGGMAVTNQAQADSFANRLNAAFAPLTAYQSRYISNFQSTGQLAGATAELSGTVFSDRSISAVNVTAASGAGTSATIDLTVNGEIYRNATLGQSIGARESITLTNINDANQRIRITNGSTAIQLGNTSQAQSFAESLRENFDLEHGSGTLRFQMGPSIDDAIEFSIGNALSDRLFDYANPNILSQSAAATASGVIDGALEELGTIIAGVGATQSRVGYASNAITDTITNLDIARSVIADTDIASEATLFAQAIVRQQAAVFVLAQTQQMGSNLVELLKPNN